MADCQKIKIPKRGICAGDLNKIIYIKSRSLETPKSGVDFSENFSAGKRVWAGLKTTKGRAMFYTTNMDQGVTHIFYIRWYAGLTSDYWIEYKGENYDIAQVDNLDESDQFYAVYCNVRGDKDSKVNHA